MMATQQVGKMRAFISVVVLVLTVALNSVSAAKPRKYQQPYQPYQQQYEPYQQPYQQQYQQPYYQPQGKAYASEEEQQDLSKIPGEPGRDYPLYHSVPDTSFSCASVPFVPGIYANVETGCQAYHVCHDGREGHQGASFLCSNGTLFDQKEFTCNWWYKVDCREAPDHYRLNGYEETNPFAPKAKSEEARSGEVDPLPGLKYYKPNRQGQAEYSTYKQQPYKQAYESPPYQQAYRQPYKQPYQQPYKPSYQQQPYKQAYRHLYKQPPPQYQQYEQQEYQDAPQQSQESYDNSQERNFHPDRFYKK